MKTDEGTEGPRLTDDEIAEAVEVNRSTVERVRIRCVEGGVDAALHRRPSRQVHARKLDGVQEAHLLALACKPWLKEQYCLPEAPSGEFVYHMQDVLDVYMRPYDPRRPLVCLEETSVQLVAETRTPLPMTPGQPARYDYAYERHGVAAVFMITEPLRGWREVAVGDQRTAIDFAHVIKHLVDVHFPDVERVVLVLDQLNVHTPGSLYEAFPPGEAKRLASKLEIHHTPKHGRDRAERADPPLPGSPDPRPAHPRRRGQRVGTRPKRQPIRHRLAVHNRQCSHQTQAPLPGDAAVTGY